MLRSKSAKSLTAELLGKQLFAIWGLKRLSPKFPTENDLLTICLLKAFYWELNKTTLILRIPSFDGSAKKKYWYNFLHNKEKSYKLKISQFPANTTWQKQMKFCSPYLYNHPKCWCEFIYKIK